MLKFWLLCGDSERYSLCSYLSYIYEARLDVTDVPTYTCVNFWYFGARVLGVGEAVDMLGSLCLSGKDYKDVLV